MVDSNSQLNPSNASRPTATGSPTPPQAKPTPQPAPVVFSQPSVPGQAAAAPVAAAPKAAPAKELSPLEVALALLQQAQQTPTAAPTTATPQAAAIVPKQPAPTPAPVSEQEENLPTPPKLKVPSAAKPKAHRKKQVKRVQNDAVARPVARKKRLSKANMKRYGIISGIAIAFIIAIIVLSNVISNAPATAHKTTPYETNAMFVRERETGGLYAEATKSGKFATEFTLKQVWRFYDGYALVKDSTDRYGIVDDAGGMSVKFGAYKEIIARGPVYLAGKSDRDVRILVGTGKTIAKTDNINTNEIIARDGIPYFIYRKDSNKYELYNARGDRMKTFESNTTPNFDEKSNDQTVILTYGESVMLLDGRSYSIIAETDLKSGYEVQDVSFDSKLVLLKNDTRYALISNGTFRDDYDSCNYVGLQNIPEDELAYATCNVDSGPFLILENGDISEERTDGDVIYFTPNTYAIFSDNQVEFIVDGESKKTTSNVERIYRGASGYVLQLADTNDARRYATVNKSGETIYSGNSAYSVTQLTANDRAIIYLGRAIGYRLVSKSAKVISLYDSLRRASDELYVGKTGSGEYEIINADGERIATHKYKKVLIGDDGSVVGFYNGKADYYNPSGKLILQGKGGSNSTPGDGYVAIEGEDGSFEYYLPSGKQIK